MAISHRALRKLHEKYWDTSQLEWSFPFPATRKMVAGSCYLPKGKKTKAKGEDAYFISDDGDAIGVADGVGSWKRKGIDAGRYARELMANALSEINDQPTKNALSPWKVLNDAFLMTTCEGSSTACIIMLRGRGDGLGDFLHAVNVGDSGFMVIRNGILVYQSSSQQHRFNYPYQLGPLNDTPKSAQVHFVEVETGDIVVAGTDGLFDNLFSSEIEDIVDICRQKKLAPEAMACTIANVARKVSRLHHSITPFGIAAMNAGLSDSAYLGGKHDDTTVIVAYIT